MTSSSESPDANPARTLSATLKQPIVFDGNSTPVKTVLFVIVCLAWLLPGLVGRDPWKSDEAIAFGVVYALLEGGGWIVPMIAGVPHFDAPPFAAWIAAAFAKIFSPILPVHDGARLASGLWVAVTMASLALAANRLLDERAGRICALMLIGSLGLLLRGHEISFALAPMAGIAIAMYGLIRFGAAPRHGGLILGAGAGLVALTAGLVPALSVVLVPCVLMLWMPDWRQRAAKRWLGVAAAITLACAALWPILLLIDNAGDAKAWLPAALGLHSLKEGGRSFQPHYFLRTLPWYALPALPIALWVWWKDRKQLRTRVESALPFVAFLTLLAVFSLAREPRDDMALPLLVPLILAAVQGLDRLPRGLASFVDWFGMALFSFLALFVWAIWTGALTGIPRNAAKWAAREAPGYVHELGIVAFAVALALTAIWLLAVLRTRRTNRRAIVNWTAGITLLWMLINLLWLPAMNHVRSYRDTASALQKKLDGTRCVAQMGLGDAQRAAFDYHAGLRFERIQDDSKTSCPALLVQGVTDKVARLSGNWSLVWEGARPGDKAERFRLYRRG
jgi:4-amino-4-deoxy-L-arabinose transferase-like glycosyltransferase